MLLDRDTRAESTAVWSCIENNRYDFPLIRALVKRCRNLSHHGDVENIDGRTRKGHARGATFSADNLWGIDEQTHTHSTSKFDATFHVVLSLCEGAFGSGEARRADEAAVREAARALRPGGALVLVALNKPWLDRQGDLTPDLGVFRMRAHAFDGLLLAMPDVSGSPAPPSAGTATGFSPLATSCQTLTMRKSAGFTGEGSSRGWQ